MEEADAMDDIVAAEAHRMTSNQYRNMKEVSIIYTIDATEVVIFLRKKRELSGSHLLPDKRIALNVVWKSLNFLKAILVKLLRNGLTQVFCP